MSLISEISKILHPLSKWEHRCHEASIYLVRKGIGNRVARGSCLGVGGQHSWVVVGDDCYNPKKIIDPTLWSYRSDIEGVFIGSPNKYSHRPHGSGSIWNSDKPTSQGGKVINLTPRNPLSKLAKDFLDLLGPLDLKGWHMLAVSPVQGWPSKEIFSALADTRELVPLVPIDRLGMLTDRNPSKLYLK